MGRPLRLDYPGAFHHVTLRTNRKEHVLGRACRHAVFDLLAESNTRFQTEFLAYAVMSNHLHLAVRSPDGRLSWTMQHFTAGLTRQINGANGWTGHVFQGRFFNRVVETEDYLRHLPAYIHLNPAGAGLPARVLDPDWTSHRAFLEGDGPEWLNPRPLLQYFTDLQEYRSYVDDVERGRRGAPVGFHEQVLVQPRSSDAMAGPCASEQDVVPMITLHRTAEHILGRLPTGRRPGVASPTRDLLALWLVRHGHRQTDIADHLGVDSSCVSRAVSRAARRDDTAPRISRLDTWLAASRAASPE